MTSCSMNSIMSLTMPATVFDGGGCACTRMRTKSRNGYMHTYKYTRKMCACAYIRACACACARTLVSSWPLLDNVFHRFTAVFRFQQAAAQWLNIVPVDIDLVGLSAFTGA